MIYNLQSMSEIDAYAVNLSCVHSYIYYHKSKYYQHIVDGVLRLTGGKWEKAVRWWVSNSARAIRLGARGFTVCLHPTPYTGSKQGIGFRGVKGLLEFLESRAFIHIYKGCVSEWRVEGGKRVPHKTIPSCIVFRERTMDLWKGEDCSVNLWEELDDQEIVEIRDRSTKEPLPTRGHKGVKQERTRMRGINNFLATSDITFQGEPIANVIYKRVFSDNLTFGGRLYAASGGVQLLPQDIRRSALRIDGESVVELDFSAIHPNICYQMMYNGEGISVYDLVGDDFCPYAADLSFVEVDTDMQLEWEAKTGEKHRPLRELAKLAILISMNAKDKASAVSGLSNRIREDRSKPLEEQKFYAIPNKIAARKVCEAVQMHNELIRERFFADAGMVLQKVDSDIMLDIVGTMLQKGHTVLCYHDSALTKASAEQDLYQAMRSAWVSVLGDDTFCKIEKK